MNTAPWWEGALVGFDLESTGVDVERDRIVTANLTYHHPAADAPRVRDLLLNPGIEIPEGATQVHGISTEHAREHGLDAAEGIAQILELLNKSAHLPLVAYNGSYDFTLLDREARRYGLTPFVPSMVIDPLVVDKQISYRRGSRKLVDTCEFYGVVLDNAHSADADALAAIGVARALGRTGKVSADPLELHAQQIGWRAEQAASYEDYLRRNGRLTSPVEGAWPVIPVPEFAAA